MTLLCDQKSEICGIYLQYFYVKNKQLKKTIFKRIFIKIDTFVIHMHFNLNMYLDIIKINARTVHRH